MITFSTLKTDKQQKKIKGLNKLPLFRFFWKIVNLLVKNTISSSKVFPLSIIITLPLPQKLQNLAHSTGNSDPHS
ncbi:hypothetical protein BpHYR1_012072 [Brachionus plicatilis]|uniref:Uncharacterized protein n=1 Tax=Brachionus plicatilis TaxID=10195 RepID=A0A3M7SSQ3_BRAPC|nr:hypothetical protein BpHYR1_012072 [Brachionus plicatilis]